MDKEFKITILTDKTSWMNEYNIELSKKLEDMGHNVKLANSKNDIEKGDVAFFLSCFEIIKPEKLKLNTNNIVVHASDLPNGKGWSPMTWQILEDKNEIPITLFEANEQCDNGDFYLKDRVVLNGDELIGEWQKALGKKIIEMCIKYIKKYGELKPQAQLGIETFYPRRTQGDSKLEVDKTIREQFNLLRVADNDNYPAFFEINGQKYKLRIEKYE